MTDEGEKQLRELRTGAVCLPVACILVGACLWFFGNWRTDGTLLANLVVSVLAIMWTAFMELRVLRLRRKVWRFYHGYCTNCGYDLRETPRYCPECGTIPAPVE
jgi:hypothetical protein